MTGDSLEFSFGSWLNASAHRAWLMAEGQRLLAFARAARLDEGFGNLDGQGRLPAQAMAETMNTARMTHCFAMAHIQGIPGCLPLVEQATVARLPICMPLSPLPRVRRWSPAARKPKTCWPKRSG